MRQGEIEIEKQKFMEALDKEKKVFLEVGSFVSELLLAAGAQKEYSLRHAMSASVWPCCISRADGGRSEACQTRVNSETSTSRF